MTGDRHPGTVPWLAATCFGIGRLPLAPGTFGAVLGVALYIPLVSTQQWPLRIGACVVVTVLGAWAAEIFARAMETVDPQEVVVDELAGVWVAMLGASEPRGWVVAFVLFRVFDVLKPFPVNRAEGLHGGLGIMADDIVAGLYALVLTWLLAGLWS